MKNYFILSMVIILSSSAYGNECVTVLKKGDEAKKYSKNDLVKLVEETGVTFAVEEKAQSEISKNLGCEDSMKASLAHAVFKNAEDSGVDYPETIEISQAKYLKNLPAINVVVGKKVYSIVYLFEEDTCYGLEAMVGDLEGK